DDGGQFCDRGYGYTSAVYFADESQKVHLEGIIKEGEDVIGQPIITPIEPRPEFFPAEDYHQDYYKRNKLRYSTYRSLCGRDRTVRSVWGQSGPETIARFKDQS
ncbi:MAG: peptide-methionine (S)-S-oxide reductase, partial [Pseudomonadota bacterium]